MSEPGDCQFEVSKYFECFDNNKDDDVLIKKKCFSLIEDYYKCIDIKSYNKNQKKKLDRSLKKYNE